MSQSGDDLAFAGAARQAEMVRSGEVSAKELVQLCLDRIQRLDPQLNAFRKVFTEKAMLEAEQADARVRGIGDTVRRVFDDAAKMQATPLTAAMELARRNLAEAGGMMPQTGTDPEPAGRL